VPLPIEDYALIGDCETAALVGRDGSIDWLCFPRFDSPACFAALLGTPEHGRWLLTPTDEVRATRRKYREGTLVLETEFTTAHGTAAVIDCMSPRTEVPDVIRIVEGRHGEVPFRLELIIRFDYGSLVPWVRRVEDGLVAVGGPDSVHLATPADVRGENLHTVAEFTVRPGEQVPFVLTWYPSHRARRQSIEPLRGVAETERWWRAWSDRTRYTGEYREAVLTSLITLKALTYAPTGGIVAAPTTSLPEQPGGQRNWDYRYCWLRDATFSLYALMAGGFLEESRAWREWLIRVVAGDPSQVNIIYGVLGERRLHEVVLDWLPGYQGARPVRVGNAAWRHQQLDIFGEVMDALHVARRAGLEPSENAWRVQRELVEFAETVWREPDEGIWEVRGPRRHFTHSKVMAWVALDRAVKGVERFGLAGPVDRWRGVRDEIRNDVLTHGYDPETNSFVQYYGAKHPDGALLMLPLVGFLPADDPRMLGTVDAIRAQLCADGFVRRYRTAPGIDKLPPGEGVFLPCSFWLADNLVLQGRVDEARQIFERLLAVRNDVGLLAEEYAPGAHRFLGNFPQAFTHVGLINTALNLARGTAHPAYDRSRG
jgi:GH15 family glucan-1,4-alpha-glucosidase